MNDDNKIRRPAVEVVSDPSKPVDQATDVIDAQNKGINPSPEDEPGLFGIEDEDDLEDDLDEDDEDVEFDEDTDEGDQNLGDD